MEIVCSITVHHKIRPFKLIGTLTGCWIAYTDNNLQTCTMEAMQGSIINSLLLPFDLKGLPAATSTSCKLQAVVPFQYKEY